MSRRPVKEVTESQRKLAGNESDLPRIAELEELTLMAIASLPDAAYGVAVQRRLEETGRSVSAGALYVTIGRLEEKALLQSTQGEATPARGGRAKTYYALTPIGQGALEAAEQVRLKLRAFQTEAEGALRDVFTADHAGSIAHGHQTHANASASNRAQKTEPKPRADLIDYYSGSR